MGQIAEDIVDGTTCTYCGGFFQDPDDPNACFTHGYPVTCKKCFRAKMRALGIQKATAKLICTLMLVCLTLLLTGCGSMKGEAYKITYNLKDPNNITVEYYKASYETLLLDWERHGFAGSMDGFGSIGSEHSRVESEGAEIVEDVADVVGPLRGITIDGKEMGQ